MNCQQFQEHWVDYLRGEGDPAMAQALENHRTACGTCRRDAESVSAAWQALSRLPEFAATPSERLRARFYDTLSGYAEGLADSRRAVPATAWWRRLWPQQPVWQVAAAAACLLVGLAGGRALGPFAPAVNPEVAGLREEVGRMRQLVALSLLQQDSATDRLRGVTFANQTVMNTAVTDDAEVVGALLRTVNEDANVNVRLAAVEALANASRDPGLRRSLAQSLSQQVSPLVQLAIIDLLAQARDRQAAPALRSLTRDEELNVAVKMRAQRALQQLGVQ